MKTGPWYIGIYETNSMKARKECQAILLLGMPNWRENNPTTDNAHSWKHVDLFCPTCEFFHAFKRCEWNEALVMETLGDYKSEAAEADGECNGAME